MLLSSTICVSVAISFLSRVLYHLLLSKHARLNLNCCRSCTARSMRGCPTLSVGCQPCQTPRALRGSTSWSTPIQPQWSSSAMGRTLNPSYYQDKAMILARLLDPRPPGRNTCGNVVVIVTLEVPDHAIYSSQILFFNRIVGTHWRRGLVSRPCRGHATVQQAQSQQTSPCP